MFETLFRVILSKSSHSLDHLKYPLTFNTGYPRVPEGYSGSNWISDADDIKATSGYVFTLGGGAVYWKFCKKIPS